MKSAYRLLALALVAIMTLGCFAACAETGDQTADTTIANAETQAPIVDVETTENLYDADGYLKDKTAFITNAASTAISAAGALLKMKKGNE